MKPYWRGQLPFPLGFTLPLLGLVRLSVYGSGMGGARAPKQGKGCGCREAEGRLGVGRPRCS